MKDHNAPPPRRLSQPINSYFEALRSKYTISIPPQLRDNVPSDADSLLDSSSTPELLQPKYLRRAYATLSLSLYFRRVFQIYSITKNIHYPIGLLFSVNAMMAHTYSQAMSVSYNCLPSMTSIFDPTNISKNDARKEEKSFWKTDSHRTTVRDESRLLFLAEEAWKCLIFILRDTEEAPICNYCGQPLANGETQFNNSHSGCYSSVSGFFVKRLREQRRQTGSNLSHLMQQPSSSSEMAVSEEVAFNKNNTEKQSSNKKKQNNRSHQAKRKVIKQPRRKSNTKKKTTHTVKTKQRTLKQKVGPKRQRISKPVAKRKLTCSSSESSSDDFKSSDNSEEFEVEKVLHRKDLPTGTFYLVKWLNYSSAHNSWVRSDEMSCKELIRSFNRTSPQESEQTPRGAEAKKNLVFLDDDDDDDKVLQAFHRVLTDEDNEDEKAERRRRETDDTNENITRSISNQSNTMTNTGSTEECFQNMSELSLTEAELDFLTAPINLDD
jgi:hypothetical protein